MPTSNLSLPTPADDDLVGQTDNFITDLSTKLDNAVRVLTGTLVNRPASAPTGTLYVATDVGAMYVFVATWLTITPEGGANVVPIGGIIDSASPNDPPGGAYLTCDGRSLARASYPALFNVLGGTGSSWGLPDADTFKIPDLRGRTTIGKGLGSGLTSRLLGQSSGAETHVLTGSELAEHAHGHNLGTDSQGGHGHTVDNVAGSQGKLNIAVAGGGQQMITAVVPFGTIATHGSVGWHGHNITGGISNTGSNVPHNNMQPFAVTSKIIRVK